jgi:hypothetical protein
MSVHGHKPKVRQRPSEEVSFVDVEVGPDTEPSLEG